MSLNYEFIIEQIAQRVGPRARVLDYGCGAGQVVAMARARGHAAFGCDQYDEQAGWAALRQSSAASQFIRQLADDGRIPFPDGSFDIVVANQVFEHIREFDVPLREISRVLVPGGLFLNLFPTSEVWHEGHCKVPFAHRLVRRQKTLATYLSVMRRLGCGDIYSVGETPGAFANRWTVALRERCFYRPRRDVEAQFAEHFTIARAGADWLRHRIRHSRMAFLDAPGMANPLLDFICSRLAGRVYVLQRVK